MVTGRDLIENGWPEGPTIGLALAAAKKLHAAGMDGDSILRELEKTRAAPDAPTDPALEPLARELLKFRDAETRASEHELRDEPRPYGVWGADLIEPGTTAQMENAMRLPVSVGGALMPDAHLGYGLPVGGVIPWAVGVDIAPLRGDTLVPTPDGRSYPIKELCERGGEFGVWSCKPDGKVVAARARAFHTQKNAPLVKVTLDNGRVVECTSDHRFMMRDGTYTEAEGLSPGASLMPFYSQLDREGYMRVQQNYLGAFLRAHWIVARSGLLGEIPRFEGQRNLALLSHSGSRGVGFKIANRYSKIAKERHPELDKDVADLAWLDLTSEEGEEYWLSMQLAGRFASANHAVIHDKVSRALGEEVLTKVENHHNFAWSEEVGGREAIVHRKGATPAGRGVMGVIPGSMGDPGYVVRGRGDERSINSAAHGAGRRMSRTQAFKTLSEERWREHLSERGITLIGGSLDEAPAAYKDVEAVVSLQNDLVDLVGRFTPKIVRMDAGGGPRRKKRK